MARLDRSKIASNLFQAKTPTLNFHAFNIRELYAASVVECDEKTFMYDKMELSFLGEVYSRLKCMYTPNY